MLQVQSLSVEIGGRLVVENATFTVMPKDKVGLVGRNGAGKTTLFKVLGGEAEPIAGKIMRKGGFGYLPQDPRIAGIYDGRTAISHILSGRNIDDDLMRLEKLRIAMEEDASERNVSRYSKAEEEFSIKGGYAAESEARSIAAGLGMSGRGSIFLSEFCRVVNVVELNCHAFCLPVATPCCSTNPLTT